MVLKALCCLSTSVRNTAADCLDDGYTTFNQIHPAIIIYHLRPIQYVLCVTFGKEFYNAFMHSCSPWLLDNLAPER